MRNWELAEAALEWRQTASSYLDIRNPLEVPNPAVSASRLRHLADQLERMIETRDEPPVKVYSISLKSHLTPPAARKVYKPRKT